MYRVIFVYPCEVFAFYISQNITTITIMMPVKSADLADRSPEDIKRGVTVPYTRPIHYPGQKIIPLRASATQPLRTADVRSSQVGLHEKFCVGGLINSLGASEKGYHTDCRAML